MSASKNIENRILKAIVIIVLVLWGREHKEVKRLQRMIEQQEEILMKISEQNIHELQKKRILSMERMSASDGSEKKKIIDETGRERCCEYFYDGTLCNCKKNSSAINTVKKCAGFYHPTCGCEQIASLTERVKELELDDKRSMVHIAKLENWKSNNTKYCEQLQSQLDAANKRNEEMAVELDTYVNPSKEKIESLTRQLDKQGKELELLNAVYRTGLNYRLTREEKRSDWKEHLERFDKNVAAIQSAAELKEKPE